MSRVPASSTSDSDNTSYRRNAAARADIGVADLALEPSALVRPYEKEVPGRVSWITRQCRRILHERLSRIEAGHVLIIDPLGQHQFGPSDDVELRAVVRIDDLNVYRQMVLGGTLGAAEAYLAGKWVCSDLTALLRIMARNLDRLKDLERRFSFWLAPFRQWQQWQMRNTKSGSRTNIAAHYDLSNEFFAMMLDQTMMYSSGIFQRPEATLEEASIAKLERICRKLNLQPGSRVVEIGTGWGGFAEYAAVNFGCHVTTTTISEKQHAFATRRIQQAGLTDRITLLKSDYRELSGQYDHLVSIEMIEAVGREYLDTYFRKCCDLLKPTGTMALQVITIPDERMRGYQRSVDFIQKYIFPGGFLPSFHLMTGSIARKTDLRIIHAEDFGPHYAQTLAAWRENFLEHLPRIRALGMDEFFLRTWEYYLAYCEAGFRERQIGVSQLILARPKFCGRSVLDPA